MHKLDKIQRDWLEHGQSEKLRKHLQAQHQIALNALFAACRKSADADVRAHVHSVEIFGSFIEMMKVNQESEEDDGDARDDGD